MRAILTIDDGPTPNTLRYLDFLKAHGITPVMFFQGDHIDRLPQVALDALKGGAIVGNHSDTHPFFSKLSVEDGIQNIEQSEAKVERLYAESGVERPCRLFRFPYFDKGGEDQAAFESYLDAQQYGVLTDADGCLTVLHAGGDAENRNVTCSYDLAEYCMIHDPSLTLEMVIQKADEKLDELSPEGTHVVLIHDHPENEEAHPRYFETLIEHLLARGVQFETPIVKLP